MPNADDNLFKTLADRCAEVRAANSCVIAVPITQNEIADHFDVTRQAVHREISALKTSGIIDKQGGRSSFTFSNLKENRGLSDKDFEFRIPRGVEVLTNGARSQ